MNQSNPTFVRACVCLGVRMIVRERGARERERERGCVRPWLLKIVTKAFLSSSIKVCKGKA